MDRTGTSWAAHVVVSIITLSSLLLASCGGGSSSVPVFPPPVTVSAPSGLSYPTPPAFSTGQAIQTLSPTVTGTVVSYSVAPQLPAGLSLNGTTGAISGTPTAVTASTSYTVTATNAGGTTAAMVAIAVNDKRPLVYYPNNHVALIAGTQSGTNMPLSLGGTVTGWSISPALPAGLAISTRDGSITGTPSAESPSISYTVTATNSGGTATAIVKITVGGLSLPDLGHVSQVTLVRFDGTHVLSVDRTGHWALWDYATGAPLASGDSQCTADTCNASYSQYCYNLCSAPGDLKGSTLVIQTPVGFEMLSPTDGHVIAGIAATLSTPSWWHLAADGSYISAGSASGLYAWSPTGQLLLSRPGNYASAQAFAAPGEIRVVAGPAGQNVVETITVANGNSSISPAFQGTFQSWFVDGERFLAAVSTTILTYSKAAVQQDATSLTGQVGPLGGSGNYFWSVINGSLVNIYTVGASSAPALSLPPGGVLPTVYASGSLIGVVLGASPPQISIVDLSGSSPVKTDRTLPIAGLSALAATSASRWMIGSGAGVLADATARYFDLGAATAVAGSNSRIAVATASGRIVLFDAASGAQQGTISSLFGYKLLFSSGGGVLAAMGGTDGQLFYSTTVNVYSLPSMSVIGTFSQTDPTKPIFVDIDLSADGTRLGQVFSSGATGSSLRQVVPATGGAPIWSDLLHTSGAAGDEPIRLSPDGTLVAEPTTYPTLSAGTNIIHNGTLVTAVSAWAVGWLDNNRFLANTYKSAGLTSVVYDTAVIYDAAGNKLQTIAATPEATSFQVAGSDSIFVPATGVVTSLTTGAALFASGEPSPLQLGAVAGPRVIYLSGTRLVAVSY
jgi:hypothetical protein